MDLHSRFSDALKAVHGTRVVQESLKAFSGEVAVVALGKAAGAMTRGVLSVPGLAVAHGFVCAPKGYLDFSPPESGQWTVHEGGHPLPDEDSLSAGAALVNWLPKVPSSLPMLVLMSGGSSSCIEHLRDGLSLDEVITRTRVLQNSGADIHVLNSARKEWSLLKGGRASQLAGPRDVRVLVISDVPSDDPSFVGSGPFHGQATEVVGNNAMALAALGDDVMVVGTLTGSARKQGERIAEFLKTAAPGTYAWGGETTVILPERPGRGGRCQHLALAAAVALKGVMGVQLLAAGTDGVDGASEDAGAVVDGGTVARIEAEGLDAIQALSEANSGVALAAAGDLLHTGPTGTNVMDLVIATVA